MTGQPELRVTLFGPRLRQPEQGPGPGRSGSAAAELPIIVLAPHWHRAVSSAVPLPWPLSSASNSSPARPPAATHDYGTGGPAGGHCGTCWWNGLGYITLIYFQVRCRGGANPPPGVTVTRPRRARRHPVGRHSGCMPGARPGESGCRHRQLAPTGLGIRVSVPGRRVAGSPTRRAGRLVTLPWPHTLTPAGPHPPVSTMMIMMIMLHCHFSIPCWREHTPACTRRT